jgi:hypothetical protein
MLLGLLAFINYYGTPNYRVNFSPNNRAAFRLFLTDTCNDLWELMPQSRALPAKQRYFFTQRLEFFMDLRDELNRYRVDDPGNSSVALPAQKLALLAWTTATYVACAELGGLRRSADPAQLKAVLAEMIAVGPQTGPLSTQLAVNEAWAAAQAKH